MTRIIYPAPQFTELTEAEVMVALADPDPGNPIAVEVARLIEGYSENFRAHVERLGYMPASILRVMPQTAIEAVAVRLTTKPFGKPSLQPRSRRPVDIRAGYAKQAAARRCSNYRFPAPPPCPLLLL